MLLILAFVLYFKTTKKPEKAGLKLNASISDTAIPDSFVKRFQNKTADTSTYYLPLEVNCNQIIVHHYYTVCYNSTCGEANWVAYILTDKMVGGTEKRSNKFQKDPKVIGTRIVPSDYSNSGYDRGHLCPAADMEFSKTAMEESFYMSNMTPQKPEFNRGIWKELEEKVRDWAKINKQLYIATGPVEKNSTQEIGIHHVKVPTYFFKVILDYTLPEIKGIGFIMENKGSNNGLQVYAVSIDSVESFTGINFFESLPDTIENRVEKTVQKEKWF